VGTRSEIGQRRRGGASDRLHLDIVEDERISVGVRHIAGRAGRDLDCPGARGGELSSASAGQPECGGRTQQEPARSRAEPAAISHR
jgi:hypothetical protein